jgi:serine/threonine-protein kinase SRK2
MMLQEIELQSRLGEGHLNIVSSNFALLTDKHLGILMEYASGGSLTQYVTDRFPKTGQGLFLTEEETRYFFRQIVSAIEYCHSRNIAHRDLKLDNTLLDGSDPPYIKICDFGFAKSWGEDNEEANLFTQIGTPVYMSPEVIKARESKKGYDPRSADIWSAGVLLYVMLLGSFPFDHEEQQDPNSSQAQQEVYNLQTNNHWSAHPSNPRGVQMLTPSVKDLMDKIFVIDSSQRISLKDIQDHPWFNLPLDAAHESALEMLNVEQAKVSQPTENSTDQDRSGERHKRLERIVAAAGTPEGVKAPSSLPSELDPGLPYVCRVDLRHSAIAADERESLLIGGNPRIGNKLRDALQTIEEGDR